MWVFFKRLFFLIPPEKAHYCALLLLKLCLRIFGKKSLSFISGQEKIEKKKLEKTVCGVLFQNPLGIAAGFDKNGEYLEVLSQLGFGFAEIGTVTPLPQSGNLPPRLIRFENDKNLFNRMGFNNKGAFWAADHLKEVKPFLPPLFRVGVNLGKNKETPVEEAYLDYVKAVSPFEGLPDYLVINVSSPNTAGLRDLQKAQSLKVIVDAVQNQVSKWKSPPPLFVKLAPELDSNVLSEVLEALQNSVAGYILTNTKMTEVQIKGVAYTGGLSGAVLSELALMRLQEIKKLTSKPIISVGGIMSPQDALKRMQAGADLIQIYSGWIYGGPKLPSQILQCLQ